MNPITICLEAITQNLVGLQESISKKEDSIQRIIKASERMKETSRNLQSLTNELRVG